MLIEIEKLKISIRDLTSDDIDQRGLDINLKGVVVTEISSKSPLSFLLTSGDIIVELQSQAIKNTKDLEKVSKKNEIKKKIYCEKIPLFIKKIY